MATKALSKKKPGGTVAPGKYTSERTNLLGRNVKKTYDVPSGTITKTVTKKNGELVRDPKTRTMNSSKVARKANTRKYIDQQNYDPSESSGSFARKGAIVKKKMAMGGSASSPLKTFNDNKAMAYKKAGGAMAMYKKSLKKAQDGTVVKDKWGRPPGSKWYGFNPTTNKYERVFESPKAENEARIQTARQKEVIDSPTQTYEATADGHVSRAQNAGSGVPGKDRYGKLIDTTGYAAGQPNFNVTTFGRNNKLSYTSIPRENVIPMLNRWKNETLGTRKTGGQAKMAKGGMTKAKKFAALAPPYNKATAADRIAGAKKNARKKK